MRLGRFGVSESAVRALFRTWEEVQRLPFAQRREALLSLSDDARAALRALKYEWALYARPEQLTPPEPWRWWVMPGGRGGGKTRPAAEQVIEWAETEPGIRIALIAKDSGSVKKTMLLGDSGILTRSPKWFEPRWYRRDKLLVWPNGSLGELHSSEEPRSLRGPQYHKAWVTELFHWDIRIRKGETEPEAWKQGIKLGLRLGKNPQGIIDSTPRATQFCADFLLGPKDEKGNRSVTKEQVNAGEWALEHDVEDHEGVKHRYRIVVRRWSSERNAENLAPGIIAEWRHDLRGSRLEAEELDGLILEKVHGALWSTEQLDELRVTSVPRLVRVLVAVDPTRANTPRDEAGIVVGGLGEDGHAYVMADRSMRGSPAQWGQAALDAANMWRAESLVREKNRLEQSTKDTIRLLDPKAKWIDVQATEGKRTRAEPVSAAYEQKRVHHVGDKEQYALLEDEMISWDPQSGGVSPNRMDALVWLVTALLGLGSAEEPRQRITML